jgi:hypothetical protein
VPRFFVAGFPWSFLLPAAVVFLLRRARGGWRQEPLLFPLLWFAAMFVFFSAAAGKRIDYLLPLMPASALLVAAATDAAASEPGASRRWLVPGAALVAAGGVAAALTAAVAWDGPSVLPDSLATILARPNAQLLIDEAVAHGTALALVLAAAVVATLAPLLQLLRGRGGGILVTAGATAAAVAVGVPAFLPAAAARDSFRPFADEVARVAGPDAVIRGYEIFDYEILFHLRRRVPRLGEAEVDRFLAEPGEGWVLTLRKRFDDWPRARRQRFEVAAAATQGFDDPSEQPVLLRRVPCAGEPPPGTGSAHGAVPEIGRDR